MKREVTNILQEEIENKSTIFFIGDPLSGKTNVLYQLYDSMKDTNITFLYVNITDTEYSIFNYICNLINKKSDNEVDIDDIKSYLAKPSFGVESKLVIIIDGYPIKSESIKQEMYELIDLNENKSFSLILSMNENNYNNFTEKPYSNVRKGLVEYSKMIKLPDISDSEFYNVNKYFSKEFAAVFSKGSEYNLDYRKVQILRILASAFSKRYSTSVMSTQVITEIPSVTSFEIIENIYDKYVSDDMDISFEPIIEAYIKDNIGRRKSSENVLFSSNKRYITYKTAKEIIGKSELDKLIQRGYIGKDKGPNNTYYIIVKCPELLAYRASFYISNIIIEECNPNDIINIYNYFIKVCEIFPYNDLVAAITLIDIYKRENNIFKEIINNLAISEPKIKKPQKGDQFLMNLGNKFIKLQIDGAVDEEGIIYDNLFPWIILSHLLRYPIIDENNSYDSYVRLIKLVASFEGLLYPLYRIANHSNAFHMHDIGGKGSIVCHKMGLIEPITFAIEQCFYNDLNIVTKLCEALKKEPNPFIGSRLYLAAKSVINSVDQRIRKCAEDVIGNLDSKSIFLD